MDIPLAPRAGGGTSDVNLGEQQRQRPQQQEQEQDQGGGTAAAMLPIVVAAPATAVVAAAAAAAAPSPVPGGFAPMESGGTYPRVAHRHLYLWIERKTNENGPEAARRLKTIPPLEAFYGEVAAANAGNKHYSPLKLQEMVVRAPPYSLL
jgi:hypothetical protein